MHSITGSPEYDGSGYTLWIEVLSLEGTPGWREFCQDVADIWLKMPNAKVHWAKQWDFLNGIDDHIRNV